MENINKIKNKIQKITLSDWLKIILAMLMLLNAFLLYNEYSKDHFARDHPEIFLVNKFKASHCSCLLHNGNMVWFNNDTLELLRYNRFDGEREDYNKEPELD